MSTTSNQILEYLRKMKLILSYGDLIFTEDWEPVLGVNISKRLIYLDEHGNCAISVFAEDFDDTAHVNKYFSGYILARNQGKL